MEKPPVRVGIALTLLWAAWLVAAVELFVNHVIFRGSQIGPGLPIGTISLIVYGAALLLAARGRRDGRALTVAFLVLSTIAVTALGHLIAERAVWSASYIAGAFALKAAGVFLLFTGDSRRWFDRRLTPTVPTR